ncbi:hypothetical protein FOZ63_023781, partial [Perkinsus olseni]
GDNGGVTFVDLGGMGVSVKEGDYEHFVKSLTLLGQTYGQEFVRIAEVELKGRWNYLSVIMLPGFIPKLAQQGVSSLRLTVHPIGSLAQCLTLYFKVLSTYGDDRSTLIIVVEAYDFHELYET